MTRSLQIYGMRLRMKQNRKQQTRRRAYISQFTGESHLAFLAASLSCMLTGALNIGIAWVMQQMIDAVSGVLGALELPVLALLTMCRIADYPVQGHELCVHARLSKKSDAAI